MSRPKLCGMAWDAAVGACVHLGNSDMELAFLNEPG